MAFEPPVDVIGAVLEDRYRVLRLIGHGGMASVFAGEDTRLRRRCALKVLHPQMAEDRDHVARFLREAQMIASLDHPNIVDIYSYGEDPTGIVYFAMELLRGEDLDSRLRARAERPFDSHQCCVWALQIAEAVAVVHDDGLIHRDLKLSNVFLARRRDGEELCKLLDFGIARAEEGSNLTRTGITLGTPSYMSPEQVVNDRLDRRSDVYSFGVLLFKLLTGRVPFVGEPLQVALQHCETPAPAPSSVARDAAISPSLDAIVLTALAKRPDERFASMRAMATALREVLREEAPERVPGGRSMVGGVTVNGPLPGASATMPSSLAPDAPTPGAVQSQVTAMIRSSPRRRRLLATLAVACASMLVVLVGVIALGGGRGEVPVVAGAAGAPAVNGPPPPAVTVERRPADESSERGEAGRAAPSSERGEAAAASSSERGEAGTAAPSSEGSEAGPAVPSPEARREPAPDPASGPPPVPALAPETSKQAAIAASKANDPLQQIERKAKKCRRSHKAVGGPAIVVDYAIGTGGKVVRAVPATDDALGACLAEAVRTTQFPPAPQLALGRKLSL